MAINYKELNENQIREIGRDLCGKNGFSLLGIKDGGEEYLRYVLAYSEDKKEYATWLLNVSVGGLYHGNYFSHYFSFSDTKEEAHKKALADFKTRG
jgi:hypothetical protein